jgi:hypothetical protein
VVTNTVDGTDGLDAAPAIRGQPAGSLIVELIESEKAPEQVVVRAIGQVPENSVASSTQIPSQGMAVLQAIGGDGEPGRRGGDGQSGRDGIPGTDATRELDAGVR